MKASTTKKQSKRASKRAKVYHYERVGPRVKFSVFPDASGAYRWHAVANNGEVVATSGESFASKSNARRAARDFVDSISCPRCVRGSGKTRLS